LHFSFISGARFQSPPSQWQLFIHLFCLCICRYKWMTYAEVGAARTAVGSGLVQNGIPKASFLSSLYHIWRTNKLSVPNGWSDLSWIFFFLLLDWHTHMLLCMYTLSFGISSLKRVQFLWGLKTWAGFMCWAIYDKPSRVGNYGAGMWLLFLHFCSSVWHPW
jgi:hypothetical protein